MTLNDSGSTQVWEPVGRDESGRGPCWMRDSGLSYGDTDTGNLLIHGDNLGALNALRGDIESSIRCVYIDPPYNNGESYTHYSDRLSHGQWLESVEARIEVLHDLLRKDGSLWISIDDTEVHYLKVAADRIFGRGNFISTFIWEHRTTRENRRVVSNNHEYILAYAKDLQSFKKHRNSLPLTEAVKSRYKNPDNDPRGPWQSVSANAQAGHATASQFYTLVAHNGTMHEPPKGRCWVYTRERMQQEIEKNNVSFGKDGYSTPRLKRFLSKRKKGLTPETLWRAVEVGTTDWAKKHLIQLFAGESLFDTPKPEQLLERIIRLSTNPGDYVLDAYLGSGTTTAVAHKLGRRYVGIENGSHAETHCALRMRKVVEGESGGISQAISWAGGGGFDFYRL